MFIVDILHTERSSSYNASRPTSGIDPTRSGTAGIPFSVENDPRRFRTARISTPTGRPNPGRAITAGIPTRPENIARRFESRSHPRRDPRRSRSAGIRPRPREDAGRWRAVGMGSGWERQPALYRPRIPLFGINDLLVDFVGGLIDFV